MINILERQFDRLAKRIREKFGAVVKGLGAYFKRLLFPLYLFPIKLITYTAYYLVKFLIKFIFAFIGLIFETIIFPFKSLKNFLKSSESPLVWWFSLASVLMKHFDLSPSTLGLFILRLRSGQENCRGVFWLHGGNPEKLYNDDRL